MLKRNQLALSLLCLVTPAVTAAAQGHVVTVTASNYKYDAPDSIPAGTTTFRLVGNGPELHHMQIVRLEQGKTMADFAAAMSAPPGPPPAWVTFIGGPNANIPDGHSATTLTVSLTAGDYVLLCMIPSPDGTLHVAKGMVKPLRVTPASRPMQAGAPRADAVLTLYDYNFDFDKPLTAGKHTILVKNKATQFHEAFLVRLPPGMPLDSLPKWVHGGMSGAPPVIPAGGTVGIGPGLENLLTVDLEPGTYALYCFMPDAKDGKEHTVHGMLKQFTVNK